MATQNLSRLILNVLQEIAEASELSEIIKLCIWFGQYTVAG